MRKFIALTFGGAFCVGQPTNISVEIFCEPELVCVPIGDFPVLGAIWYPKQYEISLQRIRESERERKNTRIIIRFQNLNHFSRKFYQHFDYVLMLNLQRKIQSSRLSWRVKREINAIRLGREW